MITTKLSFLNNSLQCLPTNLQVKGTAICEHDIEIDHLIAPQLNGDFSCDSIEKPSGKTAALKCTDLLNVTSNIKAQTLITPKYNKGENSSLTISSTLNADVATVKILEARQVRNSPITFDNEGGDPLKIWNLNCSVINNATSWQGTKLQITSSARCTQLNGSSTNGILRVRTDCMFAGNICFIFGFPINKSQQSKFEAIQRWGASSNYIRCFNSIGGGSLTGDEWVLMKTYQTGVYIRY